MSQTWFSLANKSAVVTGAGRGLGRAIAAGLAGAGARVVACARTLPECEETAALIRDRGGAAVAVRADVVSRQDCKAVVEEAVQRFGSLDIMVCNAAVGLRKDAVETTESEWQRIMDIDLTGCFNAAQAAGRQMIAQGSGGSIIVTSSNASLVGFQSLTAYCAAKGGTDAMVRALAIEWARHKIRVNAIAPGWMVHAMRDTAGARLSDSRIREEIDRMTPMARCGEDNEIAGPAVFLASPASSFITGVVLPVDGGYCAM